ncbi:hypothetical protein GIB64_02215 [Pseudomonas lactis]|uniref:hypothetical protein n=1 Tax=Pseudomonas TaxID=286 RepID=UPI000BB64A62|nr:MULTISPECIES: hypothetical protein [Pseudomonas]MBA5956232.1 hypothetical protein [Pseudomonas lactis]PRW80085.1 hypothetical protein C7A12_02605 [Pseudomonas fluorescens]PRW80860.1 hypothetical protein C7A13_06480 [Pseudomonas fluorescens]
MANTFTAPFAQKFKASTAVCTVAIGGIGTSAVTGAVAIAQGGANGSLITRLTAIPRGTITATSLVLFRVKGTAPTVYNLTDSVLMQAYTFATTTAIPLTVFSNISEDTPLYLDSGDMLYVGSQVALAAGIVFYAEQADL